MFQVGRVSVRGLAGLAVIACGTVLGSAMPHAAAPWDGPGQTVCISWEFFENCCAGVTEPGQDNNRARCGSTWCYGCVLPPEQQTFATIKYMQTAWTGGPAWKQETECTATIRCMYQMPVCAPPSSPDPCDCDPEDIRFMNCGSGCANPPAPDCPNDPG